MTTLTVALALTWSHLRATWQRHAATLRGDDLATWWANVATQDTPIVTLPPWRTAPAPTGDSCPSCGGRRCRHHREGDDCTTAGHDSRPAYAAGLDLPRPGRHTPEVRIHHWAHILRLHELRDRMGIRPKVVRLP